MIAIFLRSFIIEAEKGDQAAQVGEIQGESVLRSIFRPKYCAIWTCEEMLSLKQSQSYLLKDISYIHTKLYQALIISVVIRIGRIAPHALPSYCKYL